MNRNLMAKYDVMTVGEALGISLAQAPEMADDRRHELNMIFNFDAIRSNRSGRELKPFDLPVLKAICTEDAEDLDEHVLNLSEAAGMAAGKLSLGNLPVTEPGGGVLHLSG